VGRCWLNEPGLLEILFGGWQLGAIFSYGSGFPFTPLISGDQSNTGTFGSVRPDLTGDPSVKDPNPNRWFNTGAYQTPALYTFGNAPRNSLTGPSFQTLDMYLAKRFGITKDLALELRLEGYNILNRANFAQPDPFIDSDSGGTITGLAGTMRELQWGLRLYF
jgi:hypothetical protein